VVEKPLLEAASEIPDGYLDLHIRRHIGVVEVEFIHPGGIDLEYLANGSKEIAAASTWFTYEEHMAPGDHLRPLKAAEARHHAP